MTPSDWLPTEENLAVLPAGVKQYIHALETNADPAGTVRQNVLLRDEVAQLRALVGEMSWQPIETAPEDAQWWLVWSAEYQQPAVVTHRMDNGTYWEGDWDFEVRATHWMPLPPPPTAAMGSENDDG